MGRAAKGSEFERWVCRKLSLWVTGAELVDVFWRTATSGGRATMRHKKGAKRQYNSSGDIMAMSQEGLPLVKLFTLECKFIKDLNWTATIDKGTGKLAVFWEQAKSQCAGYLPFLIVRQNFMKELVFVTWDGWKLLSEASDHTLKPVIRLYRLGAVGFYLSDLFLHVPFKDLIAYAKAKGLQ